MLKPLLRMLGLKWSEPTYEEEEFDDLPTVPDPSYAVGEWVVLYNPYDMEIIDFDWGGMPLYYEVEDVKYDVEDDTYRYKLKHNHEWYAEDWVARPEHPMMTKVLRKPPKTEDRTAVVGYSARKRHEDARHASFRQRMDSLLDEYLTARRDEDTRRLQDIENQMRKAYERHYRAGVMYEAGGIPNEEEDDDIN